MARFIPTDVHDELLGKIATADEQHACSQQPTSFADVGTYSLAAAAMTPSDFVISSNVGGRRLTVGSRNTTGTAAGTGDHVALVNAASSELLFVTTSVDVEVVVGGVVEFRTWSIQVSDPGSI